MINHRLDSICPYRPDPVGSSLIHHADLEYTYGSAVITLRRQMPIYEYKCTICQERFDVEQSIKDDTLTVIAGDDHEHTVKKVFHPVGIAFKGEGFYKNDTRSASSSNRRSGSDSSESSAKGSSSGSSSSDATTSTSTSSASSTSSTTSASSSSAD